MSKIKCAVGATLGLVGIAVAVSGGLVGGSLLIDWVGRRLPILAVAGKVLVTAALGLCFVGMLWYGWIDLYRHCRRRNGR